MARKVFMSFLGFSDYKKCRYYKDDFCSTDVRFIQEATLDYLLTLEEWSDRDVALFLLTEGAYLRNWRDDGQKDPNTKEIIKQPGLATRLKQKGYPFPIETIDNLPEGKSESELFEIFRRLYEALKPGDSLYLDITHGFRSLPMLALVLVNYAKFLKKIEVKSITYGNFEARQVINPLDGDSYLKAPIIDLMPLSGIQDWTFAAADYLKNGNADRFTELSRAYKIALFKGNALGDTTDAIDVDDLVNSLKSVTDDFQTCRGDNILKSKNIRGLKERLDKFGRTVIEPLNPVIKEVADAFSPFSTSQDEVNIVNGMEATKWCMNNNLYQQAATILQECVVTFFCIKYNLNIYTDERQFVNGAFAKSQKLNSSKTREKEKELIRKDVSSSPITQKLLADSLISDREVYEAFMLLTDERNDINHSGMRLQPHPSKKIRNNIKKAFDVFQKKLLNQL